MTTLKKTKKYYFTVEGETEKWYFEWLQKSINESTNATCKVTFDCKIQKNPIKRVKALPIMGKTTIYHIADYESNDEIHVNQFTETIDNLKTATLLGKQVDYKFGYTNFTFDLWIILHKSDCNTCFAHRKHYIKPLNSAYNENFENMDQYKHESNFKRCLSKLHITNTIDAINRAKAIMKKNHDTEHILHQYKGYSFYKENPSLMTWASIEKILKDCELI